MPENKTLAGVTLDPQVWPELTKEHGKGMLAHHPACYALWFYYGLGYDSYTRRIRDKILLEGEPEPVTNHKQLFKSASMLYGVEPEEMVRFWPYVDAECRRQWIPIMPDPYKFNKPLLIVGPGTRI